MPGKKLGKSFRWFFGKIEGATTPDIVLPLITCPPIFSDLPPALVSSGFVGKNHADVGLCRRYEGGLSNFVTSETQFLHSAMWNNSSEIKKDFKKRIFSVPEVS